MPVGEALARFRRLLAPFAAIVDGEGRYLGAFTEGMARKSDGVSRPHTLTLAEMTPLEYPTGVETDTSQRRVELMARAGVDYLPILDAAGKLVRIDSLHALLHPPELENLVAIMAGGQGTRLRAVTGDAIPKALVPIGPRPLVEMMVEHLRGQGFRRFAICARHLARNLVDRLGDGARLGVSIRYVVEEKEALGTAGGLSLLAPAPSRPIVVLNGDVLTRHDFAAMLREHQASGAAATVGLRAHAYQIPFGVAELDPSGAILAMREKPVETRLVNAGVYVLSPRALAMLRPGEHRDMTELIEELIARGESVRAHMVREEWLDVGTPASYREALEVFGAEEGTGGAPATAGGG